MRIYHKKNFAVGLFFTALGLAFLGLMLARWEFPAKSVLWCAFGLLTGPSFLLHSFSREASRRDRIEEQDERNVQVALRAKSAAFSILRYVLLGMCWLCMAAALLGGDAPERQLAFTAMSAAAGAAWFLSLVLELVCEHHYGRRM